MNLNINTFTEASILEINQYAEVLVTKAIERINLTGKLQFGQITDLVVIDEGIMFTYGDEDCIDTMYQTVEAYEGVSLLRAEVYFNELFTRYELVVKQIAKTIECVDEHVITGILKHHGDFRFYIQRTKLRGKDV